MTEAEWVACRDWRLLFRAVKAACFAGKASARKQALFALACCRRTGDAPKGKEAAEVLEQFLAGGSGALDWDRTRWQALELLRFPHRRGIIGGLPDDFYSAPDLFMGVPFGNAWRKEIRPGRVASADEARDREGAYLGGLLRDVFADLFLPRQFDRSWVTPTVRALAKAAYDGHSLPEGLLDPARLAVLADALEEGGCTDAEILVHLRGPGPHVRGCWVLDLLLGKE